MCKTQWPDQWSTSTVYNTVLVLGVRTCAHLVTCKRNGMLYSYMAQACDPAMHSGMHAQSNQTSERPNKTSKVCSTLCIFTPVVSRYKRMKQKLSNIHAKAADTLTQSLTQQWRSLRCASAVLDDPTPRPCSPQTHSMTHCSAWLPVHGTRMRHLILMLLFLTTRVWR